MEQLGKTANLSDCFPSGQNLQVGGKLWQKLINFIEIKLSCMGILNLEQDHGGGDSDCILHTSQRLCN